MLQTEKLLKERIINDLEVAGDLAFSEHYISDEDRRKRAISTGYGTKKVYCNALAYTLTKKIEQDYNEEVQLIMDNAQNLFHITEYAFCIQWEQYKKTYIPDSDFFELLDMSNKKIYPTIFKNIKYPCFAVEFREPILIDETNILGAIVDIEDMVFNENSILPEEQDILGGKAQFHLAICLISDTYETFFYNVTDLYEDMKEDSFGKYIKIKDNDKEDTFFDIYKKIINFTYYLCSINADIKDDKNTQKIESIKNPKIRAKRIKNTEYKSEVGVRIGNTIRFNKKETKVRLSNNDSKTIERKPVTPHIRGAHWSHRWHGHGDDKVLKPCFIEPTFVNLDKGEIDEVKQKVCI